MTYLPEREQGSRQPVVSLSGIVGHKGREIQQYTEGALAFTVPDTWFTIPANSRRISALITLNSTSGMCEVRFDNSVILGSAEAGDSLQIDKDLPWTGEINIRCIDAGKNGSVNVLEISVIEG